MTNPVPTGPAPTAPVPTAIPLPPAASSATRHLCAGAYLDEEFQRASLNEVYHQNRRSVAPSYGFDLVAVLGHCLRARRLAAIRDAVIVAGLVIAACVAPLAMGAVFIVLITLYLLSSTWRLVQDTARELRKGRSASAGLIFGRALLVLFRFVAAGLLFVLLSGLLAVVAAIGASVAGEAGATSTTGLLTAGLSPSMLLVLMLLVFAPPVAVNLVRQSRLEEFTPGRVPGPPSRSVRFDEIRRQESGNTVVFSGYRPFVGSGFLWKNWGFAQRLVRAAGPLADLAPEREREFTQAPFTAGELVEHLRGELKALTNEPDAERHIPGLTVDDRIFLAGTEVPHLVVQTEPGQMAEIIRNPTAPARHYLVCQVVSWRGELVTTVFVHVAVQGKSLYVEFTSTALPPCDERFRVVDQVDGTGLPGYLRAGVQGLLDAPLTIGRAPFNLLRAGFDGLVNSSANSAAPARPGYDHGAKVSVRELGMAPDTRNHVQTQEIDKYQRIVERRLLAAVLDFLEARGVDTSEYRQRAMTVLNTGAVVTGGSLTVHGDVAGTQVNTGGTTGGAQ